jgi:hypothetical protein
MKQPVEYSEIQPQKWWMWALMAGISAIFIFGTIWQVVLGNTFGNNPVSDAVLIITTVIMLIYSITMSTPKLKTCINNVGVYVRYFPFSLKSAFFAWDDIEKVRVVTYNALSQYGGWGVRHGYKKKAYIVSGKYGLELELKNGRKILIGTQNPEELEKIISKLAD